ncbi:MAG TPA: ATP-binding protein [Methylomirabilota bacterium]|nr:ATP-binding protein [Methylomirabilota bacterium]
MAAVRQILELLRSHAAGDEERFRTAALQIAANEARQGHDGFAQEIQQIVERSKRRSGASANHQIVNSVPFGPTDGELAGLLEAVQATTPLSHLILPRALESRLRRVLKEHHQFGRLREHGLRPRQRLLLLGPPGCGKTITAHALAHDLGLPLFVVRLDAIFTKFLGETASKLRVVFNALEQQRAVFLFDEFDSLGLARGSQHDIAEMRRVLNSFLVFLDTMRGYSLIVAASNHPEALDPALFRRFDDIIEYSMPTRPEIEQLLRYRLAGEDCSEVDWHRVVRAAERLSFAESVRVVDDALKERLIEHKDRITTELLLKAITDRELVRPRALRKVQRKLHR